MKLISTGHGGAVSTKSKLRPSGSVFVSKLTRSNSTGIFSEIEMPGGETVHFLQRSTLDRAVRASDDYIQAVIKSFKK